MRELKQIQQEIENIIEHSQDYSFKTNASDLVDNWYKAKKFYIDLFGGETTLLVRKGLSIELSEL